MRENEIVLIIKQKGVEKGFMEVALRLAEELNDINRTFKEFAAAMDTLTRVVGLQNNAMDGMQDKINSLHKQDDDPSSTRGML